MNKKNNHSVSDMQNYFYVYKRALNEYKVFNVNV